MKITVVGAGIMGLSAAWALQRDGHDVAVFEQGPIPNALGASVDEHRLIRHPYGGERGYTRMINPAYAAWDQMWADLGAKHYAPTGTLVLDRGATRRTEEALTDAGVAFERLSAATLAERFPLLSTEGLHGALELATGGTLFAGAIVADLARYLRGRGASVAANRAVRAVDPEKAQVTLEGGETVAADRVIVAAGPWAPRLLPQLKTRVTPSRQVVVYLTPPADLADAWQKHPLILDIDPGAGFYLVPPRAFPSGGVSGLKIGDHSFSLSGDPDRDRMATPGETRQIIDQVGGRLRGLERYQIREAKTCFYDVEAKERFIVEPVGAYGWVMSGFSGHGFKFAALLGLELARTLRGERMAGRLSEWAAGWLSPDAPAVVKSGP